VGKELHPRECTDISVRLDRAPVEASGHAAECTIVPMSGSEWSFREAPLKAYFGRVIILVRLARVLCILLLAFFTVSLVIGLATSETGVIEKVVLLALIAGCVFLAAKVSTLATRAQARIQRH
jgi:hypothetical protein